MASNKMPFPLYFLKSFLYIRLTDNTRAHIVGCFSKTVSPFSDSLLALIFQLYYFSLAGLSFKLALICAHVGARAHIWRTRVGQESSLSVSLTQTHTKPPAPRPFCSGLIRHPGRGLKAQTDTKTVRHDN